MALHPITIVDQVIQEYRNYLLTEFRARDEKLRKALEEALTRPLFLAQDAFFQTHRPFKSGKTWKDLGLDNRLAGVMEKRSGSKTAYLHQSEAISNLLSSEATPLVVTTGTGSGKTECFLLPVIQNAIEDSANFKRRGLTAILVYPMNALANDQEMRIKEYLQDSGHTHVKVERYDRSTKQEKREEMRKNPPHILLTNYMMLEYLLVRPADRDDLFANHRCRFVVLDEVHSYRGSLGANIALLFRRLKAHLADARQDWANTDPSNLHRFPKLLPVATSATIKSVDEADKTQEEVKKLRDEAVQEFLGKLTGYEPTSFKVLGEEIKDLEIPLEAKWPSELVEVEIPNYKDSEAVRITIAKLAGMPEDTPLLEAIKGAKILWTLNDLLARKPLSMSGIVQKIIETIPERANAKEEQVIQEVKAAIVAGAALPDGTLGALRLRTHRFIKGGWRFHRCVSPDCGKLYAMGEERCKCGKITAPLYLCRSCGADALRFSGSDNPEEAELIPNDSPLAIGEWILYAYRQIELEGESEVEEEITENITENRQSMKNRPVYYEASFDPETCSFSSSKDTYPMKVALAPSRNSCLVCGAMAGSGNMLSPVALGTSAAVKVVAESLVEGLAEQNSNKQDHDGKERLLIFADSRQDAAHQARFITYSGRYDRMRRRLVSILETKQGGATLEDCIKELMNKGVDLKDNDHTVGYDDAEFLPAFVQKKAKIWEEAPLLDDLAVSVGYRASVFNLGLIGVRYDKLERYVEKKGDTLVDELSITKSQLFYLCRIILDEMRTKKALSRPILCYHPSNPNCPEEFKFADWERRFSLPIGYSCSNGEPVSYLDASKMPEGIRLVNIWRKPGAGGRAPSLQKKLAHLLNRMGGIEPKDYHLVKLLSFLKPNFVTVSKLSGYRKAEELLQVNADSILLEKLKPEDRYRCTVCNVKIPWVEEGSPCPSCHGVLKHWSNEEIKNNRYVQRILKNELLPLVAGEHTAQVTGDARIKLEEDFKNPPEKSPINVLACSPTLEMGIDVGGLDAVVMRNVPPRPDNYAQRGGRAGRRSRVGIVLGYARNTPHDGYFYDRPQEMIAGEVPAPAIGLGNRDVVQRHLNAIAFGASEPGLSGKMADYISLAGQLNKETVEALINAVSAKFDFAAEMASKAWDKDILEPAGFESDEKLKASLSELPDKIRNLFERVSLQILQLEETIKRWSELGQGDRMAVQAMELKRRLLGLPGDKASKREKDEADDRSSGHPMRRFAEFGILPGYEFPTEPATLRLLGDQHEEEPISVERRFGLAQYQPDAQAHARGHKWRVIGLDTSSPWNPKTGTPTWDYVVCPACDLRYGSQEHVKCPRCGNSESAGISLPGYEFGGFLARRDDAPIMEEEDRFAMANLLKCYPQWNGDIIARYKLPTGWQAELRRNEEVRWVNESKPPTDTEKKRRIPCLHEDGKGFYLCPECGRILTIPEDFNNSKDSGRKKAKKANDKDSYNHATGCSKFGQAPQPLAISTKSQVTTFRILVDLPKNFKEQEYLYWGQSLGYALRAGMRHLYMLEGSEIEFDLEPIWEVKDNFGKRRLGALTFIDGAVGGSGFLEKAATELHIVAKRTIEHLEHSDCETACYRCLKSYQNQRYHQYLSWPRIILDLESLSLSTPEKLSSELGDIYDPKPWLEAYEAGVGSPLELAFLRLFERYGLEVEKQMPISLLPGEFPISIADFGITESRIAIYVDSAAFHVGNNLRRDKVIRRRLQETNLSWQVVELTAKDLAKGEEVIKKIKNITA